MGFYEPPRHHHFCSIKAEVHKTDAFKIDKHSKGHEKRVHKDDPQFTRPRSQNFGRRGWSALNICQFPITCGQLSGLQQSMSIFKFNYTHMQGKHVAMHCVVFDIRLHSSSGYLINHKVNFQRIHTALKREIAS